MTLKDKKLAYQIYLYLGALFITSLVVSNLISKNSFIGTHLGKLKFWAPPYLRFR